jgi:hypothetical protein
LRFITAVFFFAIVWFLVVVGIGEVIFPTTIDPKVPQNIYIWGVILYASVLTINRLRHKG